MELPVHKHLIIRTEVNNPPGKDKQEYIKDWFRTLVKDIDMKLLSGPYCEYVDVPGNEGLTFTGTARFFEGEEAELDAILDGTIM